MATVKELEAELERLKAAIASAGIRLDPASVVEDVTGRADYVEFGSERHLVLLGLVRVGADDDHEGVTYTSPATQATYGLRDEYEPVRAYPGIDPEKAALLVLRQKVGEFEAGPPPVPGDAPALWRPADHVS